MHNLLFVVDNVAPIFLIVALGYILRRRGLIDDGFVRVSSRLVFNISLPVLIFVEVARIDLRGAADWRMILFAYAATLAAFALLWAFARPFIRSGKDFGAFLQGSFRGNLAIIGLALVANLYGAGGLGKASVLLAFLIPLYNVLSVLALAVPLREEKNMRAWATLREIAENPLVLGVVAALPFSYFRIPMGHVALASADYLAALAFPLALIGVGGFLKLGDVKESWELVGVSALAKLVLIPAAATFAAYRLGFAGSDLGILFVFFSCPAAVASFIMAEAMGANGKLAGSILVATTAVSAFTISLGLFALKQGGVL